MIKTHTIMKGEDIGDLLVRYVQAELKPGDVIFISERRLQLVKGGLFLLMKLSLVP